MDPAAEQLGAPSDDDDGVVGDGDDGGDEEDHEVTDDFEAGAEPEHVYLHSGIDWDSKRPRYPGLELGEGDWPPGSRGEEAFPDVRSQD